MNVRTRSLALIAATTLLACGPASEPPAAPSVDAVPALTNQNPLTITGTAEASALVSVRGGAGATAEATADADGKFSVDVMLNADTENHLLVTQTVGTLEGEAAMVTVTHDGTAPDAPALDPVVSPTRRDNQHLRGTTEANATVTITGGAAEATGTADDTGHFDILVMLNTVDTGTLDNQIAVTATDAIGNVSAATDVTITYDPSIAVEAPALDAFPAYTSMSTITLTGTAEAGVGISAVGGATDGMVTAAADGTFSVDVGLRPNQRNRLLVFAVSAGVTSTATTAVIVHDDIAPEAPNLDPQASPTGATVVTLSGTAEPGVDLAITGGAADASGTADDFGTFAIDVTLTTDADNELSVVATDLAGNESDAATVTITQDSTLEEPIRVDPIASPTRDATVTLTGTATPDVDVEITGGVATVTAHSDATSGDFSASVQLQANARNELHVTRPGSGIDTVLVIVHDSVAPDAPTLNDVPSPTGSTTVNVSGTTEPGASVSVTGGTSAVTRTAGTDGRFSMAVTIAADTSSTLSVIATDRAGNSSAPSTVSVTHSSDVPEPPVVDDANPPDTNVATLTVTGHVTAPGAGITVRITGGAAEATGTTDETSGVFSVEVTLNANAVNSLEVTAVNGAIESSPAIVTITHDDTPPAAPETSLITANRDTGGLGCGGLLSTAGTVFGSAGAVEGGSRVFVWNITQGEAEPAPTRTTPPDDTATAGGSFSVTQRSCTGDAIGIKVMDSAGNVSTSVEVSAS